MLPYTYYDILNTQETLNPLAGAIPATLNPRGAIEPATAQIYHLDRIKAWILINKLYGRQFEKGAERRQRSGQRVGAAQVTGNGPRNVLFRIMAAIERRDNGRD